MLYRGKTRDLGLNDLHLLPYSRIVMQNKCPVPVRIPYASTYIVRTCSLKETTVLPAQTAKSNTSILSTTS